MIVAFSTSSPLTSVALLEESGRVLYTHEAMAPGRSSEALMTMLQAGLAESGLDLKDANLFVADQGPGSFTGVRVGIVAAKMLAWNYGVLCAGIDAFDLIAAEKTAYVPSRKGEFFLREPGQESIRTERLPNGAIGYGEGSSNYPLASRVGLCLHSLSRVAPEALMPQYRMEPSISIPKRPLSRVQD